jgi:peptidoglycan/xylan/chitin deacetylase (PgdA/CDA1 family)
MFRIRARLATATGRTGLSNLVLTASGRLPPAWQRLTILTWHRVAKDLGAGFDRGVIAASPEQFDRQIAILKENFSIIDTASLVKYREEGRTLPLNPALLTFDDGYRDNVTLALPILKRHRVKAVFFIPTGFMGKGKLFSWEIIGALIARCRRPSIRISYPGPFQFTLGSDPDRGYAARRLIHISRTRAGVDEERFLTELATSCEVPWDSVIERRIADELILDWDGVRDLVEAEMEVQSHGHSHALFPFISPEQVLYEASQSRQLLETRTGQSQVAIAYPAGAGLAPGQPGYNAVVKAGYKLGFCLGSKSCRLGQISDWLGLMRLTSHPELTEERFRGFLAFPNFLC